MCRYLPVALAALLLPAPASARVVRITRDEVRCVTITSRDGSSQTHCSLRRRQQPVGRIPRAMALLPVPRLDLTPPLTRDEIPDTPSIPDAPDIPGPNPFLTPAPNLGRAIPAPSPMSKREMPPPLQGDGDHTPKVRDRDPEARVLTLLNAERRRRNLSPLALDAAATRAAQAHSRDMCQRRFFSHISPEGTQPWDRLRAAGASFKAAAENIAVGYRTPEEVHRGWLDSPGHRANRLNPVYRRAGVGLHVCGDAVYWTELFLK